MVFREIIVAEGLIDLHGGASSAKLSAVGFGGSGMYHFGIEGGYFQLVLRQFLDALAAWTILDRCVLLFQGGYCGWSGGRVVC